MVPIFLLFLFIKISFTLIVTGPIISDSLEELSGYRGGSEFSRRSVSQLFFPKSPRPGFQNRAILLLSLNRGTIFPSLSFSLVLVLYFPLGLWFSSSFSFSKAKGKIGTWVKRSRDVGFGIFLNKFTSRPGFQIGMNMELLTCWCFVKVKIEYLFQRCYYSPRTVPKLST